MCCKKATTYEGKEKRLDKISTMVSTIKVSAYFCLKYVQIKKKNPRRLERQEKQTD